MIGDLIEIELVHTIAEAVCSVSIEQAIVSLLAVYFVFNLYRVDPTVSPYNILYSNNVIEVSSKYFFVEQLHVLQSLLKILFCVDVGVTYEVLL